tara:strand:- start:896 stop:1528 length:633 start_codon:yes stop_codon:yes gene_type:complete
MCVFAAPALVPLANATAVAGTAAAAGTGLFGLGAAASNLFLAQLGISAVTSFAQMQQQQQIANYQYEAAYKAAEAANQAYVDQTEALNARLREEKQAAEQDKFKVRKKVLQAKGAIRATERAGLTVDLLLADAEREAGNWVNSLEQTIQSADRQYGRNLKQLEAQRKSRTNAAIDMRNQAAANAPSLLGTIANVANTGLTNYINYSALAI